MARAVKGRLLACAMAWCVFLPAGAEPVPPERDFEVRTIAPGIHALVRTKAAGMMLDSNVVFIVTDRDVVVVDANLTPGSARRSIAGLRELTARPVRYLINTHRHADHTGGNATWRAAYPGLEIVGHPDMRADLARSGQATLDGWIGWARRLVADLPEAIAGGRGLDGTPLDDEQLRSYGSDLDAARELAADAQEMRIDLPDLTVDRRMTLRRGPRTIEVLAPGRGHTRGDLVVWLPAERVLVAGDLLVTPVPLVGADQSYPEEWIATLDGLLALEPQTIVPGHGSVESGTAGLQLYRAFFAAALAETRAAMARGDGVEQATGKVDLDAFRIRMAGNSRVLSALFAAWARTPTVAALYRVRDETRDSPTPDTRTPG